ncbi:Uncharacterized protein TCM_006732 [Theobroma cacao]|uniref:RNase H type-1 domain-containing protein n=1 Tax=Theobroma cacao TaxID=3641 RepID=A0A061DYG0_THECC|nr:Uncharacterized protein TCM_006732 [Theobroma cacao]
MAILHALRLFSVSTYSSSHLIVESNSRVALSWINCVKRRPWDKWHIFNEIDSLLLSVGDVSFTHVFR